jgi:DHA2 family multidrug resistance protein
MQPAPMQGARLILGTAALALATFMNVLDTSIANVSLPAIAGDLGVSTNQGTWVITSFGVANAVSVPLTGWLTQRFGAVRLFVCSVVAFVVASWLCGLAPSIQALIAFRVLQGLVAGPVIPLSQTLLMASYPKAKMGMALAIWSMTMLVAPVVGPLLGGWITDNASWPWIFYINVPVGLTAAGVTWLLYRHRETPRRRLPIDGVGLALLIVWVGALQVMLDKGKELDWFSSPTVITLAVIAAIGCAVFVAWELTETHPVVDLTLFVRRNFLVGTASLSLGYGLFFGSVVLLPLWLQQFMGYTATAAGMALAPVGLLAILLSPPVGKTVGRVDPRIHASLSFVIFAIVLWMRSHFDTQDDLFTILLPTLLQGASMAFFFIPLTAITLSGIPAERVAAASGLSNFVRITAGSFGTSIATTLWDDRAQMHRAHLVERLGSIANPAFADAVTRLSTRGFTLDQALAQVERAINQQAFTMAADDVFYGSALLFLALIAVVWFARPQPADGAAGEPVAAH